MTWENALQSMLLMVVMIIFKITPSGLKFNVLSLRKSSWIRSDSSKMKINSMSFSREGLITEFPALKLTSAAHGKCQQLTP